MTESPAASTASAVAVTEFRPGILLMTLDMPNKGANILSSDMFKAIDEAISPLLTRDDIQGLILYSAKPKIFVAGADLVAINQTLDWPDERIVKFCDDGRTVMRKFSQTPFPTVAAIHGACVGGGLELTLFADRRVASDDRRTILGLPESKLGLVPGWGGTIHIARIAAAHGKDNCIENQIELVTSGQVVNAAQAAAIGFVDAVVPQDELLAKAAEMIESDFESQAHLAHREKVAKPLPAPENIEQLVSDFGTRIVANKAIFSFAPTVALEHILRSATLPIMEAFDSESLAMAQVYGSPASYGLINNFFLGEHNKKKPGFVDLTLAPAETNLIGIVGAGLMGKSISANNVKSRKRVRILDSKEGLANSVATEINGDDDSVSAVEDYQGFAECDLVIETAVEDESIKANILPAIESAVAPHAVIASNTSAIPISRLGECLTDSSRLCGIHFCHPKRMSLVEVIKGKHTSEQTIATAVGYVRSIRKMPVVVNDEAGFVVNRLLSALLKQAMRLFVNGHSIESIDGALREFGFEAGPFEMVDIIGADTCFHAGQVMWDAGLKCVSAALVLPRLVKLKRLGQKTGVGFYNYSDEQPVVDAESQEQLQPYVFGTVEGESDKEAIVHEILAGIVLEAARLLDEEIVADYRDIDVCIIHGFGFPAEHGGILFWADRFGIKNVVNELERLGEVDESMKPCDRLKTMADRDETFYSK